MSFEPGDQVGVSVKGRMVAGPATILAINLNMGNNHPPMYDILYPNENEATVIYYDLFPYWDQLKIGDKVPTQIPLRKALCKRALDQAIRDMCDLRLIESEPGGPVDLVRAFLGVSAPNGCGRLSADLGQRWTRKQTRGTL
jgi:hypothetical protein